MLVEVGRGLGLDAQAGGDELGGFDRLGLLAADEEVEFVHFEGVGEGRCRGRGLRR